MEGTSVGGGRTWWVWWRPVGRGRSSEAPPDLRAETRSPARVNQTGTREVYDAHAP